jgi:hypothetical protein
MTSRVISGGEFAGLFPEARRSIFRMEDQRNPLTAEQAAYERFLRGAPLLPPEWPEWQAWLNKVRGLARQGTLVSRIIIIDDPVAPYQQWRMWAGSWHRQAGEGILFLPRRKADTLGIRGNWCLFDDEQAVDMTFTPAGGIGSKLLITGPEVSAYLAWRNLAGHSATPAETSTA